MSSASHHIPAGWREFYLGELLSLSNGINADKSAYGRGVPFANVMEVIARESLVAREIPGLVTVPEKMLSRYRVKRGDVLINRTSETQDEVGLTSVYIDKVPIVFGGFVFRGRPIGSEMEVDFSKYALRSHPVREQITARGQGGIRANIGQRDLKSVRVLLPPLPEQRVITRALDDASLLIRRLEYLIAKKQAIKQGMMHQLLSGRVRLPGFAKPWPEDRLGDHASMSSGGTPPSGVSRYYGGGVPWVSISDMTQAGRFVRTTEKTLSIDGLKYSAAKLYPDGVVLYAMYASLGECAIAEGRVSSSQAILGIAPGRGLHRDYLYYQLTAMKAEVSEMGQQGAQSNLNAGMVRDFRIPVPPQEEQEAIVNVLSDADDELDLLHLRLEKARGMKTGMAQQLLTGRTRLPVQEAA